MQVKKFSAVALSALMATTAMLPMSAFAQQTPSVEYTGGDGSNITHLYLIANDENLANNNTVEYNQTNAKVQVPVAINYVAQANGNILGPADEQAQIRNFSGFPVNVANIKVNAGTNVTLVNTVAAADTADEIYLQMKPNSGTTVAMADFTASATESATGLADGTGKRPDAGTEWNIAAAQSGVGTSSAVASVLNLNSLSGKIGGFNLLNPAAQQEIGQIEWTVKAGTYAPTLPAHQSSLAAYSLSDLQAISADLSTNGEESEFYDEFAGYIADGSTWTSGTLRNLSDTDANGDPITYAEEDTVMQLHIIGINHDTLSSDHTTKAGLTLQAAHVLPVGYCMNNPSTNIGGWADSALRTTMNSGAVWNMMPTDLQAAIVSVDKISGTTYDSTSTEDITTTSDKLFLPSYVELVGSHLSDWTANYSGAANARWLAEEGTQYAYYSTRVTTGYSSNSALAGTNLTNSGANFANGDGRYIINSEWWERSCSPSENSFMAVFQDGTVKYNGYAHNAIGILPCFCL